MTSFNSMKFVVAVPHALIGTVFSSIQSKTLFVSRRLTRYSTSMSLVKNEVVPDVIDKAPSKIVTVKYGSVSVDNGNILTPRLVKDIPTTISWGAEKNELYTVCMTDPDAPSRNNPKFREWHHWLVVNIPGEDISNGETLSEYVGSGPPQGSGLHRYVYLVYKQPNKLDTTKLIKLTNRSGDNRANFSIKKFAAQHGLGDPIAANLYQAEWDDYVPILYKQLGE